MLNKDSTIYIQKTNQLGFTLLELVLVLFLISLMASATLFLTDNLDDQASYDETKRRMDIIRQAIVGDSTRRLNGQTEISGFAADMGRLPECLRELMEQNNCANDASLAVWSIDESTGVASGWRGPYIRVIPESDGNLRFRDGYRNSDASDAQNSGWSYAVDTSGGISIISLGLDSVLSSADDVSAPELVTSSDWLINQIYLNIVNQNVSDALPSAITGVDLNLRIYNENITSFVTGDDGPTTALTIPQQDLSAGLSKNYTFQFDSSNAITTGINAYTVVCHGVPSGPASQYVIFDGDCDTSNALPSTDSIETFFIAPRQTPILNWAIQ